MSNITTQVAKSSGFGEQPIRVGSSSFSRPAALIGGATALIALTAIATTLVVRPAAQVSDAGVEALFQGVEVHDLVRLPENIVEPALGHAAMERHLAALEAALPLEP